MINPTTWYGNKDARQPGYILINKTKDTRMSRRSNFKPGPIVASALANGVNGIDWSNHSGYSFTGDNGDDPNPLYWYTDPTGNGNTDIQSNNLVGSRTGQVATELDRYIAKYGFSGDFQWEVRWVRDSVSNPTANDHYISVQWRDPADTLVGLIKYSRYSTGNDQPVISNFTNTANYVGTLNTGGFKFTRVSGVIKAWVWDNVEGRWEWANNAAGFEVEPANTDVLTPVMLFVWRVGGAMAFTIQQTQNISGAVQTNLWKQYTP
jgi:hypothetical protein